MAVKILLADDSVTIQKVVSIIFGGNDYALTIVDNGKDAIARAAEILPDILLIDAVMPGMTGYDVCREIRTIPPLQNIPILLLTGSFDPVDEERLKQCGANDFIEKPFESHLIITKVTQLCGPTAAPAAETAAAPAEAAPPAPEVPPADAEPQDIWAAFTAAPPSPAPEPPPAEGFVAPHVEPDVFTLVTEDDTLPDNPSPFTAPPALPSEWAALGIDELGLADGEPTAAPDAVPAQTAASAPFTEEQLRAAVAAVSKDVIERIVWEVVPDLAETLIKDAIRRIKEGN